MGHRRLLTAFAAVSAASALLLAGGPAASAINPAGSAARPDSRGGGRTGEVDARVWVTTPDRAELLHDRGTVPFTTRPSDQLTISVDPSRRYQTVDGFGASITDSSAAVLYRLNPAARDKAMRNLFDPVRGIGISALRQPMGSSDFTDEAHYTYDDMPAGQTDFDLNHFSIEHDRAQILPLLRRAKALDPRLTLVATPWSPPAWMKTNGSLIGGRLRDEPRIYAAYAQYFVKFIKAYAAAGVPVDYVTMQNEPQNRQPKAYPGTDLPATQEIKLIEAVGPALRRAGLRTRILAYDHNWATHPDDVATTPPGTDPETDYPYEVLASPAAKWVAGTAYHCYYGDPSAQSALHDSYPDKGIWFTECSGSHGPTDTPAQVFRGTLTWHARNITIGTTRNWAKSVITWNVALDPTGGRTTAAATPAPDCSPSTVGAGSPPTPSTTRSDTSVSSCARGRSVSRAPPSAPPGGTARSWTWHSAIRTAPRHWWCTTRTTTRARSRSRSADARSTTRCPVGHWPHSPGRAVAS